MAWRHTFDKCVLMKDDPHAKSIGKDNKFYHYCERLRHLRLECGSLKANEAKLYLETAWTIEE